MNANGIDIGQAIKFYRKKQGLTQEQVAESSGLSVKYISLLENGSSKISVSKNSLILQVHLR